MSKKQNGKRAAPPAREDVGGRIAATALAAALLASALAVDTGAEASFDAPKRLLTLLAVAVAAAGAFLPGAWARSLRAAWRAAGRRGRLILALLGLGLAGALLSALLSPRQSLSLDAARALFLFALLLPLGASRILERRGRLLLGVFLLASAGNAAVSVLQGLDLWRPFPLEAGGRAVTGAFAGNVGYLAVALALASAAALAVALQTRIPRTRALCAAALVLFLAALAVNQNLTSLTALAAGAAALLTARFGRRALLPIGAAVAAVALALAAYGPARQRAADAARAAGAGDWDRLLTYRLGPWAAAAEMVRERPLAGFGPGTFGAEFVPHRLEAEIRAGKRLLNPLVTSSYSEAHSDPLQALAEGGIAGLAALAAGVLLLAALWRAARAGGDAAPEAALLLAVLVAGAVASLTWFPFQRPISAVPLLLAAGRGWRITTSHAGGKA